MSRRGTPSRMLRKSTSMSSSSPFYMQKVPQVSAVAWTIYDISTGSFLWGKNSSVQNDMASLTKVMTALLVKKLADLNVVSLSDEVTVQAPSAKLRGTTCHLKENDKLKVIDLLYGMMLNSGNDSAHALATFCGKAIFDSFSLNKKKKVTDSCVKIFVKAMNYEAQKLGMKRTVYRNPHGLPIPQNISTAEDLGKLCSSFMLDPLFQKIVSTMHYEINVTNHGENRTLIWKNTNVMLGKNGVTGLKTGFTKLAGPCLSLSYAFDDWHIVIVLLNSSNRWQEVDKLIKWATLLVKK